MADNDLPPYMLTPMDGDPFSNLGAVPKQGQSIFSPIKKYGLAGLIAGGAAHFKTTPVDNNPFEQLQFKHGGAIKLSKANANYRPGSKKNICAECTMFRAPHKCTSVSGFISPLGLCDYFDRKDT